MNPIYRLPVELVLEITDYLPSKDITRFMRVDKNHHEILKAVINRLALEDMDGMPPLDHAAYFSNEGHVRAILKLIHDGGSTYKVCEESYITRVQSAFIKATRSFRGFAEDSKYVAFMNIVELLLLEGARLDIIDEWGCLPIHWAITVNRVEVVRVLLDNGADVNVPNSEGSTPLDLVFMEEDLEDIVMMSLVKMLLGAGANATIIN